MDARYKRTSLFRRIEKVTIHPKVASHFDMSSKTNNVVPPGKVAFVTGANGISGHAFIEHLIRTPESKWSVSRGDACWEKKNSNCASRSKIIVTSRRPLLSSWLDPRVEFVALDFLEPAENIVIVIKTVCKDVTHTYFTSYVHSMDFSTLAEKNCPLFRNFLDAVDSACPKLERIRLQTGGKVSTGVPKDVETPENFAELRNDVPGVLQSIL